MLNIALDFRAVDSVTEQQVAVRAWRAYAEARFVKRNGALVAFDCFIDPDAPFSIIPHALSRNYGHIVAFLGVKNGTCFSNDVSLNQAMYHGRYSSWHNLHGEKERPIVPQEPHRQPNRHNRIQATKVRDAARRDLDKYTTGVQ